MKKTLLISFILLSNLVYSQVSVGGGLSAQFYIQDVLIGNPNFPASNFTYTTFEDVSNNVYGIGLFYGNGTDLPFDEGLVLSTGNVAEIVGPNTTTLGAGNSSWLGDLDLETNTGISSTLNATSIEFDFLATAPCISLDFLLASEEYGQFECNFGDTFAFLLTDMSTGLTKNLAVIPNTMTPISILSVRGGDNVNCSAENIAYFGRYNYTIADPNIPSIDSANSPINFNGQTSVFVLADQLTLGNNYHLKIVVADYLDSAFDSALFIRNSSFGAFPTLVDEPENIVINDDDNDGNEIFDLTISENRMLGTTIDTSVYSFDFTYHVSEADANTGSNVIPNPETYTNTAALEEIYVRMQNTYTGTGITTSFRITIDAELLSTPEFQLDDFVVYPNPVLDELTIDASKIEFETIQVYNMNGQLLQTKTNTTDNFVKIDFSNLDSGVYFVQINSSTGKIYKRVIK